MKHLLTFATCLLAMAAMPAAAAYITFAPADGPVSFYRARVRTLKSQQYYSNQDPTPLVELGDVLPTERYWIDVQACTSAETDNPHTHVAYCDGWSFLTADFNEDGTVDQQDLALLAKDWGHPYGPVELAEMVSHWRARTQVIAEGLRWYVEE